MKANIKVAGINAKGVNVIAHDETVEVFANDLTGKGFTTMSTLMELLRDKVALSYNNGYMVFPWCWVSCITLA